MASGHPSVTQSLWDLRAAIARSELRRGLFQWCLLVLVCGLGVFAADNVCHFSSLARVLILALLALVSLLSFYRWVVRPLQRKRTFRGMLREVERSFPVRSDLVLHAYRMEKEHAVGADTGPLKSNQAAIDELELIDRDHLLMRGREAVMRWGLLLVCVAWVGYGFFGDGRASHALQRYVRPQENIPPLVRWEMTVIDGSQQVLSGGSARLRVGFRADCEHVHAAPRQLPVILANDDVVCGAMALVAAEDPYDFCYAWTVESVETPLHFTVDHPLVDRSEPITIGVVKRPEIKRSVFHVKPPRYAGSDATSIPGPPEMLQVLPESEVSVALEFFGALQAVVWRVADQLFPLTESEGSWKGTVKIAGEGEYEILALPVADGSEWLSIATGGWSTPADQPPRVMLGGFQKDSVHVGERLVTTVSVTDEVGIDSVSLWVREAGNAQLKPKLVASWNAQQERAFEETASVVFNHLDYPAGTHQFFVEAQDLRGGPEGVGRSESVEVEVIPVAFPDPLEGSEGIRLAYQREALLKNRSALRVLEEQVTPPPPGKPFVYTFQQTLSGLRAAQEAVVLEGFLGHTQEPLRAAFRQAEQALLGGEGLSLASSRLVAVAEGAEVHLDDFEGRFIKLRLTSLQNPDQPLEIHELKLLGENGQQLPGMSVQHWNVAARTLPFTRMSDLVSFTKANFLEMLVESSKGVELDFSGGDRPVSLGEFFAKSGPSGGSRAYLYQKIVVDAPTRLTAEIGGLGSLRLWVNRKLLGQWPKPSGIEAPLKAFPLQLDAGENELMLEVGNRNQSGGDFLFQLRKGDLYMNVHPDGTLFATGLPKLVAVSGYDPTAPPSVMMDGNLDTTWRTHLADQPTLLIDLGASRKVSRLALATGDNRIIDYSVRVLDAYAPVDHISTALNRARQLQEMNLNTLIAERLQPQRTAPASPRAFVRQFREIVREERTSAEEDVAGRLARYGEISRLLETHESLQGMDAEADVLFAKAREWVMIHPLNAKDLRRLSESVPGPGE